MGGPEIKMARVSRQQNGVNTNWTGTTAVILESFCHVAILPNENYF